MSDRAALRVVAPGLAPDKARLLGEGVWGRVLDAGDGTVIKLVRQGGGLGDARELWANERAALEAIGRHDLPVAVPRIVDAGHLDPGATGYAAFLRVTRLPGTALDDDTLPVHAARPDGRFAAQLGEALAVLHALAPEAGFADTRAEVDIAHLHAMAADLAGIAGPAAVAAIEEDLAGLDRPGAAVPSHGDINSTNLLVDEEGNLSGLIDWAEARRDRREGEFCHLVLMPQVLAPVRRAYERATGVPLDERALALAGLHNALIGIVICRRIGEIEEADWNVGEARRLTAKLGLNEPATD